MKNTWLISLILLSFLSVSCTKGDEVSEDILGGRSTYYNSNGRKYMMNIADNLVTDILDELDLALEISRRGTMISSHFVVSGSLTTSGSTWSVKAGDNALNGMTIHCSSSNCWTIDYSGQYPFDESNYYPTTIALTVRPLDNTIDPELSKESQGWRVSLHGSREERNGYGCSFETATAGEQQFIDYVNTRGSKSSGWDYIFGNLFMTVYKDQQVVDACCLSFEGSPSQATFIRGL